MEASLFASADKQELSPCVIFLLHGLCVLSEGYPADSVATGTEETPGGHKSLSLKAARCVRIAVAA